jgi:hypothetical protein
MNRTRDPDNFAIPERSRTTFIDNRIVEKLPPASRTGARERATRIAESYEGQDAHALSVLAYAAERGKFDEFAGKLERHFDESLGYVHPEVRRDPRVPSVVQTAAFFRACYTSLGIQLQR